MTGPRASGSTGATSIVFLILSLVPASPALSLRQDDAARAKELLDDAAEVMKKAKAIAFETEVRVKVQTIEVVQRARALLERPNLVRLEISGAGQDALIVLDGSDQWHHIKAKNRYLKTKQLGTAKVGQYGIGPVGTLFFEKGPGSLLPYLTGASVTKESLGKEECSVIAWKVGAEETRLWICGRRLRRFSATRSVGEQSFKQIMTFGAIDLEPPRAADSFTFTPPPDAQPMEANGEARLLAVGTEAPDFAAAALDGREVNRRDLKGAPVLLTFWFYG
jgi:hypothetical protein